MILPGLAQTPRATQTRPGTVPLRRAPGVGDLRVVPRDVTVRSTVGVQGFNNNGTSRAQIGGTYGANLVEKTVDITQRSIPDERTPFWTFDEQSIYYSSNQDPSTTTTPAFPNQVSASGRYKLFRIPASPAAIGTNTPTALNDPNDGFDYLFPTLNANGNKIAFIRSNDGKAIDDPTKVWNLYSANLPLGTGTIETTTGGAGNLRSLTLTPSGPVVFPVAGTTFANVGRPAWLGDDTLIFSGRLSSDSNYHIFSVAVSDGTITQLTAGPADERNPAVTPLPASNGASTIAFDSNATPFYTASTASVGYVSGTPRTVLVATNVPTSATGVNSSGKRNIFTMTQNGTNPQQFSGKFTGAIDTNSTQPAWSSYQNNSISNATGLSYYLAFASTRQAAFLSTDSTRTTITGYTDGTTRDIYYVPASTNGGLTITPEGAIGSAAGARRLDTTDDSYVFDDQYPTWAQFITAQRIAFQSNRTGRLIAGGFPNSSLNFTLTPGVNDLFIATVIDINAPTLLRFDTSTGSGEVVHINPVTDGNNPFNPNTSMRNYSDGLRADGTYFFTVRVDDRESGMRPDKAVFLQIKNPNSKYQSRAQGGLGVEHKEFMAGSFTLAQNNAAGIPTRIPFTGIVTSTGSQGEYGSEYEAEAISLNTTITTIGKATFSTGTSTTTYLQHKFNVNKPGGVLYEAGNDDFAAFSGVSHPPLDGASGTTKAWLELKPLVQRDATGQPVLDGSGNPIPVAPSDGQGGILYGASLKIPAEASDWYIDVILYDNAVNPFNTAQRSNFIIYDNVWGFSSATPSGVQPTDILVVGDYTLGQKFFRARFNTPTTQPPATQQPDNLLPINFGGEAYITDVDVAKNISGNAPPNPSSGTAQTYNTNLPFVVQGVGLPNNVSGIPVGSPGHVTYPNTLGVASYNDELLNPFATTVDGQPLPNVGRYSIWRILARGPVPTSLLQAYLPQTVTRPADTRLNPNGTPYETTPQTIQHNTRLVVWTSPFSGDLFVGPGTITDLQTQTDLANYVQQGGKLFISGQDIAFALKGNNQANTFFDSVLQASFLSDDAGTDLITPVANSTAFFDSAIRQDPWQRSKHAYGYYPGGTALIRYSAPNDTPLGHAWLLNATNTAVFGLNVRGDASFTARAIGGTNDVVTVRPTIPGSVGPPLVIPSAYAEAGYSGGTAMLSSFYGQGRVVYASYGFESMSNDWYAQADAGGNVALYNLGRRAEVMNNIKSGLRNGTLVGRIVDNNGSPVAGALARAVANIGAEPGLAAGTAITDANGFYQIQGLAPDSYTVFGYKQGYYSQHGTQGNPMDGGSQSTINLSLKTSNPGSLGGGPISSTGAPANNRGGVFRSDGVTPIPGIEIQARMLQPDGQTVIRTAISSDGTLVVNGQTLPAGAYLFPSLLIGDYTVIVNAKTTLDSAGNVIANPRYNALYPEVVVQTAASPFYTVSGGTVINNLVQITENNTTIINFFLPAAPQPVKGRVLDEDTGKGIPGAVVIATPVNGSAAVASAITDADGNYTLLTIATPTVPSTNLIPSNTYTITGSAGGYGTDTKSVPTVTVVVGGDTSQTVTAPDILLKKLPPGAVSGRVSLFNGATTTTTGVGGAVVNLYLVTTINGVDQIATTPSYSGPVVEPVTTGANGYLFNYYIPNVAPGTYVAAVTKNGLVGDPAQIAGIVVVTGAETKNVNFTLQPPQIYGAGLQLISVPVDYSALPDPRAIFGLSSDSGSTFNIAEWTGSDYNISPTIPLRLGKGYFVRFPTITPVTLPASGTTATSFVVNLTGGWNLIGHPFANQVNASGLAANIDISTGATYSYTTGGVTRTNVTLAQAVADNAVQSVAYGYTGSQSGSSYRQTALIQPYFGYWFRAYVPVQMTLKYPGESLSRAARLPVTKNGKFVTVTRAQQTVQPVRSIESKGINDWRIQIAAKQGDLVDSDNSVGVAPDAGSGFDNRYDNEKPPMATNAPTVYVGVKGISANGRATTLADSVQSSAGRTTKSWDITVETTGTGDVMLYWPNINRLPRGVEPVLVDVASGRRVSMRTGGNAFRFAPSGRAQHQFRIEVAPPSSQPLELVNLRSSSTRAQGANGQSAYRFTFSVTREVDVDAQIQTLSGRTVRRFASRAVAGTESAVVWDGRDESGNRLPTGPYVLNLTVRDSNGAQVRQRVIVMSNR